MNDLISRQAVIDYCYSLINAENPSDPSDEWNYSQERINQTEVILHHLEFMPSAQPDPCDAISRADAIRVASGYCHPANVAKELAKLPSVQPDNSCDGCKYEDVDDGVLVPCGFCKRSHSDNYERRTDES